ncbi:hypothetical protein C0993_003182 [Termitomyces sp. T159_Od127]|nr:hypothetical protein C0993_003182 [Termitomyces sp. T159_Od127]
MSALLFGEKTGRKKALIIGVIVRTPLSAIFDRITVFEGIGNGQVSSTVVANEIDSDMTRINTATAPVWQSETSKSSMRGKLIVLSMIMNIAGFSLSNWMTYGFSFLNGSITWRFPIAFQLVFSFILLSTVPWLPESPRWLLAHEHYEEGLQVLAELEGSGATARDDVIVDHAEEILAAARAEKDAAPSWLNIFRGKAGNNGMIQRLVLGADNPHRNRKSRLEILPHLDVL